MIEQRNINSTNVRTAAYDDSINTLYVEFNSGFKYKYVDIPKEAFENLCVSPSPGKYIQQISRRYKGIKY